MTSTTSQALATLADVVETFTAAKPDLPVASSGSLAAVEQFLAERFPLAQPNGLAALVKSAAALFERWEEHSNSPRHFGLFRPGSSVSCVVADALVALYNPNLARASFSPPGIGIERYVLRYLGQHIGFGGETHDSHFTTCGAEANQTAVLAALHSRFERAADEGVALRRSTRQVLRLIASSPQPRQGGGQQRTRPKCSRSNPHGRAIPAAIALARRHSAS